MKKNAYFIMLLLFFIADISYGRIGIGTMIPDPSSILDITSTARGLLAPHMSTAQRTIIASPATTNNRITYEGKKGKIFQVNATVSFSYASGSGNTEYAFFFMRIPAAGGTVAQVASETLIDTNARYIQAFPIQGSVYLEPGDPIELWIKRTNNGGQTFRVRSFNMTIQ